MPVVVPGTGLENKILGTLAPSFSILSDSEWEIGEREETRGAPVGSNETTVRTPAIGARHGEPRQADRVGYYR